MNKLIFALCLVSTNAITTRAMADDTCQAALNKVRASLASADDTSSINKDAKCKAYMRAYLVSMDSLTVCKNAINGDADEKAFEANIKPLMEQLAHGEETYCGR